MEVNIIREEEMNRHLDRRNVPSTFSVGDLDDVVNELRKRPDFFPDVIDTLRRDESIEVVAYNFVSKDLLVMDLKGDMDRIRELETHDKLEKEDRVRTYCR